jgi:hypothetical protein
MDVVVFAVREWYVVLMENFPYRDMAMKGACIG